MGLRVGFSMWWCMGLPMVLYCGSYYGYFGEVRVEV